MFALQLLSGVNPMQNADEMRTRPMPECRLCGSTGEVLYDRMSDLFFPTPGEWDLRRCPKGDCGLAWLDPVPIEEDIGKAYRTYYTHSQPAPGAALVRNVCWGVWHSYLGHRFGYRQGVGPAWTRLFAPLALLHPGGRDELEAAAMHLHAAPPGSRVLDVGCGSGVLLARMQSFGWQVEGVEPDPSAVEAARKRGVTVRLGTLEQQKYPDDSFDAVHSAHVIEHLHNPEVFFRESWRILKPGGTLVVLTPNVESWGSRRYGRIWPNLDPPRHLVLFSRKTLGRAAERHHFTIQRLDTTVRNGWVYGAFVQGIRKTGRASLADLGNPGRLLSGMFYQLRQRWAAWSEPDAGDEVLLIARKPR